MTATTETALRHYIGRYEILQALALTPQMETYLGLDPEGRKVTIRLVDTPEILGLIERAASVKHPNLAQTFDIAPVHEKKVAVVSEFVEGNSLEEMTREKPLRFNAALELGLAIGTALVDLHRANVVHGDLRAGNIIVADDGRIKVGNVGTGMVTGSFKLHGSLRPSMRDDWRALGTVLHESIDTQTLPGNEAVSAVDKLRTVTVNFDEAVERFFQVAHVLLEEALQRHLAATFRSETARESWLRSPNPFLDGERPIDLLESGEVRRVDDALEALNSGVYI